MSCAQATVPLIALPHASCFAAAVLLVLLRLCPHPNGSFRVRRARDFRVILADLSRGLQGADMCYGCDPGETGGRKGSPRHTHTGAHPPFVGHLLFRHGPRRARVTSPGGDWATDHAAYV